MTSPGCHNSGQIMSHDEFGLWGKKGGALRRKIMIFATTKRSPVQLI